MPSQLAVLAGWCFVAWLMKQDQRARVGVSWSLLIPGFWLAMQGSRPLSFWLGVGDSGDDSNLLDTVLFAGLLVSAVIVLRRKGLAWGALARENRTLFLLYFYFVLSIVWSDLPVLSTKRIVKDFGCVLMGLVMLSQANPSEAIRTVYV